MDVVRTKLIVESRKLHGDKVLAFITERSYEIDDVSDIEFLEFILTKKQAMVDELFNDD